MSDLKELRKLYSEQGLSQKGVDRNPFSQFKIWFDQAVNSDTAEPDGMCLSTISSDGKPSQRTVLMKAYDENGFIFYTNHNSRKGIQLKENTSVSALFPWLALHRQIIIEGEVSRIDDEISLAYFHSRPRGSQIGAWASRQSQRLNSRCELEEQIKAVEERFEGQPIPLPEFWGGYRIKPNRFEFWQGRNHRIHDRIIYHWSESEQAWKVERLSP
ncbi:MAG: pyridoxamine 5'-phosphate oxidase [Gammaproteobacteria bacterium]|nr:pyridoxamine 5'-phosphate oxidase [Gammaproteobacteria bacterium]